jgi:hypothetical protein
LVKSADLLLQGDHVGAGQPAVRKLLGIAYRIGQIDAAAQVFATGYGMSRTTRSPSTYGMPGDSVPYAPDAYIEATFDSFARST